MKDIKYLILLVLFLPLFACAQQMNDSSEWSKVDKILTPAENIEIQEILH